MARVPSRTRWARRAAGALKRLVSARTRLDNRDGARQLIHGAAQLTALATADAATRAARKAASGAGEASRRSCVAARLTRRRPPTRRTRRRCSPARLLRRWQDGGATLAPRFTFRATPPQRARLAPKQAPRCRAASPDVRTLCRYCGVPCRRRPLRRCRWPARRCKSSQRRVARPARHQLRATRAAGVLVRRRMLFGETRRVGGSLARVACPQSGAQQTLGATWSLPLARREQGAADSTRMLALDEVSVLASPNVLAGARGAAAAVLRPAASLTTRQYPNFQSKRWECPAASASVRAGQGPAARRRLSRHARQCRMRRRRPGREAAAATLASRGVSRGARRRCAGSPSAPPR